MKSFWIFFVLVASTQANHISEKLNDANYLRIASPGLNAKDETFYMCYLSVNFIEKQKTCGCVVHSHKFVMTSARCVYE